MKNLEEFLAKTKPGARKSKLHEFLPALNSLRDKGYTLNQIQEYLHENDVVVSVAWLSAFLRLHVESRTHKNIFDKPNHNQATRTSAPVAPAPGVNPLRALSGKPREGDFNPIPTTKFEVDNS